MTNLYTPCNQYVELDLQCGYPAWHKAPDGTFRCETHRPASYNEDAIAGLPPGYRAAEFIDERSGRRTVSLYKGDDFIGWYDALPTGTFIACLSNMVLQNEDLALARLVAAGELFTGKD